MTFEIPQAFAELRMDCPEAKCRVRLEPHLMVAHLMPTHGYSLEDARLAVNGWIESFDTDDEGYPIQECPDHGFYRIPGTCAGCEDVERQVDEAIEIRHRRDF